MLFFFRLYRQNTHLYPGGAGFRFIAFIGYFPSAADDKLQNLIHSWESTTLTADKASEWVIHSRIEKGLR